MASSSNGRSNTMERESPPVNVKWWAKRTFGYGVRGSTERLLDRGQVFKLEGLANDRLLVDLGYIAMIPEGLKTVTCRMCGGEFIDQGLRDGHGKERHDRKPFVPPTPPSKDPDETAIEYQNRLDAWAQEAGRQADAHEEARSVREDSVAPLDLTKTTASRRG